MTARPAAEGRALTTLRGAVSRSLLGAFLCSGCAAAPPPKPSNLLDTYECRDLAFSSDGKFLAAAREHAPIQLWDVPGRRVIRVLKTGDGRGPAPWPVAFSPDGRLLAAVFENDVQLWDVAEGELIRTYELHKKPVRTVAFSLDGRFLLSGGDDRSVKVTALDGLTEDFRIVLEPRPAGGFAAALVGGVASALAVAHEARLVAPTPAEDMLLVWEANGLYRLRFDPERARRMMVIYFDDVRLEPLCRNLTTDRVSLVGRSHLACASRDGRVAASLVPCERREDGREVLVQRVAEEAPFRAIRWPEEGEAEAIALSGDGARLALVGSNHAIHVWDTRSGALLRTITEHEGPVRALAFAPDGRTLAAANDLFTLRLWAIPP